MCCQVILQAADCSRIEESERKQLSLEFHSYSIPQTDSDSVMNDLLHPGNVECALHGNTSAADKGAYSS